MLRTSLFLILLCLSNTALAQSLADLYDEVKSSVVVINVISMTSSYPGQVKKVSNASLGSGVLISEDGKIWTAAHVIQAAERVQVEFLDGDSYDAQIVTSNAQADVAMIQVGPEFELKRKKVATIGDSDRTRIGEDVFVLGAPHGFKQSLSRGILSGRYEPEELSNDFVKIEFLQTDAAINPGNSGGPMFNMNGEVIGIASRIYTESGGFDGIGFAISSKVAHVLLSGETSMWSGIESVLITNEIAAGLNVPQRSGLLITNISSQGTASAMGLQGGYIPSIINGNEVLIGGDIILEIGGITIEDNNSLFAIRERLRSAKVKEPISISILRHGQVGKAEFYKQ